MVPLATIALSLFVANGVIAFLSSATCMSALGLAKLSIPKLVPIFLVVIIFGSGTDYCLFLIGRFREETMAFPPGVTVKDYTWGGSEGYLAVKGSVGTRYRTIIQIVPVTEG